MLFEAPQLDSEEKEVLERIQQLKKELGFSISPRRWFGMMRRNTFARAIRGSNTIEGFNVSVDDAVAAVVQEEPLDPKTEAWAALSGYRAAMTLVLQKADDPHFAYSTEFLNALHFMMVGYDLTNNSGRWRPGTIFVRDDKIDEIVYEGPNIELVPSLMYELIDVLNKGDGADSSIINAAMGHLNLVLVHPYSDGNGRMARALQTLILSRSGSALHPIFISIEEYLGSGENTQEYYDVLSEVAAGSWQPERTTRPWIRFNLKAHFRQATTLRRRADYMQRLFDDVEVEVKKHGLPERAMFAVAEAAIGYRVRNATYRKTTDISDGAAGRDLKALVESGLLVPKGEKRGRHYLPSPRTLEIAAAIPRPKRVGDPFETLTNKGPFLPGMEQLALS